MQKRASPQSSSGSCAIACRFRRTEAGNLDYRLYRSTTDHDLFFLFSRYASEKSFDIHLYQPYSLSMLAEFEELLDGPPKVETYETILG